MISVFLPVFLPTSCKLFFVYKQSCFSALLQPQHLKYQNRILKKYCGDWQITCKICNSTVLVQYKRTVNVCIFHGRPVAHVDVDGTQLDVEATFFCYLGKNVFGWWWLRSCYCCSLFCGLGQVQKAVANPHFKAHLFQDTRQGVHSLRSVNYAPW